MTNKKTIESAVAHLNGYAKLLEAKNIPAVAVYETISKLKKIKFKK